MGGKGKHQQQRQKKRGGGGDKGRQLRQQQQEEEDDDDLPWYAPPPPPLASSEHHSEKIECAAAAAYLQQPHAHDAAIDKYSLYQRSVQVRFSSWFWVAPHSWCRYMGVRSAVLAMDCR